MNSSKALLFVDDEPEILDILSDLFQDEGYNLYTATRVDEALDIIEITMLILYSPIWNCRIRQVWICWKKSKY